MADGLDSVRASLGDRYGLGEVVARGGMATIYRADDRRHGRIVAVKVFDQALSSAVGLKRFQNEIAIASALQHPALVPVFDSGGSAELLWYTMPLIAGESLRSRLTRETQLPIQDALAIARDVAGALAYAHAHGVVHRDIKPDNIMLVSGRAMVTDFGIARAIATAATERLTSSSMAIGTVAYMAPEQADSSESIDGRADIYALGCVLYEMLAGDPPFTARTAQAIVAKHFAERPPSLEVVRATVPPALQVAVERALAKVPSDRFATASDFAVALANVPTGEWTGGARVPQARQRFRRPPLLGLAMAAGAALAVWLLRNPSVAVTSNRVVVFPFETPGNAASTGTGEQVALMIGSVLEHTEPLRWIVGPVLSAGRSRNAARDAGAQYYVDGAVVAGKDSLTVIVRLHDAVADSLVRQESATGPTSAFTAPQLALRAIGLILPHLLPPNGRVDLSYLADRNAAAIADWLQGEQEYARSQFAAALDHMDRALAKDSAMGVAALTGAKAAAALEDFDAAERFIGVALRLDKQLPERQRVLAHGIRYYLLGAVDSAVASFRVAQRADTTWSEPWTWLGETYYHLFPDIVGLDSLAEVAYTTALQLNPAYAPAMFHLAESAARRGAVPRSRQLLAQFQAANPDSNWAYQLELTVRCAADGPDGIDWAAAVRRTSERVVNVARILGAGARYPACSRRALESVLAFDTDTTAMHVIYRWSALKGLSYQAVAEGKEQRVVTLLDSALATGVRAAPSLYILAAVAGSPLAEAPAATAMATLGTMPINKMTTTRLHYLSLWEWHRRNTSKLDSVASRSRVIADSTRRGADQLVANGAAARLALVRGDTTAALRLLRALHPVGGVGPVNWDPWESLANERLLLAQLLLATGDARGAIDAADLFDSPRAQIHLLYLAPSLAVREAAAARLGLTNVREGLAARLRALRR
ncbi:MAG: serine/threonine-protein kinase [Gemmatimonadales bacterium]